MPQKTRPCNVSNIDINKYIEERFKVIEPLPGQPIAIVMVGGPGSGKSTSQIDCLSKLFIEQKNVVKINPDMILTDLYDNDERCREKVNIINDNMFEIAYNEMYNIIFDGTGKDYNWTKRNVINLLKKINYKVYLCINLINPDTALERAVKRAKETGRYVSENYLLYVYSELEKNIKRYTRLDCNEVDGIVVYDNNKSDIEIIYESKCNDKLEKEINCYQGSSGYKFLQCKNTGQQVLLKPDSTKINSSNNILLNSLIDAVGDSVLIKKFYENPEFFGTNAEQRTNIIQTCNYIADDVLKNYEQAVDFIKAFVPFINWNKCVKATIRDSDLTKQLISYNGWRELKNEDNWDYDNIEAHTPFYRGMNTEKYSPYLLKSRPTYFAPIIETAQGYAIEDEAENRHYNLQVVSCTKKLKLFKFDSLNNINRLLHNTFENREIYNNLKIMIGIMKKSDDKSPIQVDKIGRMSSHEQDFSVFNWLCNNGFDGYSAGQLGPLSAEIAICLPQESFQIEMVIDYKDFIYDMEDMDALYSYIARFLGSIYGENAYNIAMGPVEERRKFVEENNGPFLKGAHVLPAPKRWEKYCDGSEAVSDIDWETAKKTEVTRRGEMEVTRVKAIQDPIPNSSKNKNKMKLSELYDKICGTIIGHSYGDALGASYEFKPFSDFSGKLNNPIKRYSRYHGNQKTPPGQITDDTEMAFALLHTLIGGYTKEKAVIGYMEWVNNLHCKPDCKGNAPFTGRNTRNLFTIGNESKPSMKLYDTRFNKTFPSEELKQESQSNGCLMRSYPLAFINNESIIETDVKITNPSDFTTEAVNSYVLAVRMAILGYRKDEIKLHVEKNLNYPKLEELFSYAVNNTFVNVANNKRGWVGYGFYCAFWALFNFDNYKDAVDAVICLGPTPDKKAFICDKSEKQKLLGDTDTNAAIAGALLGAYYGIKNMCRDSNLREDLRILVHVDTTVGDIIRPLKYYPNLTNFENITNNSLKLVLQSLGTVNPFLIDTFPPSVAQPSEVSKTVGNVNKIGPREIILLQNSSFVKSFSAVNINDLSMFTCNGTEFSGGALKKYIIDLYTQGVLAPTDGDDDRLGLILYKGSISDYLLLVRVFKESDQYTVVIHLLSNVIDPCLDFLFSINIETEKVSEIHLSGILYSEHDISDYCTIIPKPESNIADKLLNLLYYFTLDLDCCQITLGDSSDVRKLRGSCGLNTIEAFTFLNLIRGYSYYNSRGFMTILDGVDLTDTVDIMDGGNIVLEETYYYREEREFKTSFNLDTTVGCDFYKKERDEFNETMTNYGLTTGKTSIKLFRKKQINNTQEVNSFEISTSSLVKKADEQFNYKYMTIEPSNWINI